MMRRDIRKRQNSEWSLDRLAAQRWLYRRVKHVERLRLLSVLFVVTLLLLGLVMRESVLSIGATVVVVSLWFLDLMILARCVGRMKEEAAAVQEDFDCFVLDIPWPEHLGVERPTKDRVKDLVLRARDGGAKKELSDWYEAKDIPEDSIAAQLHCQRVNCHWDGRLRRAWICSVQMFAWVVVVVCLVVGVICRVSLYEVMLGMAAGIKLLTWVILEQSAQSSTKERIQALHGYLSRAEAGGVGMTLCDVRLVQAAIFEHRRACPTVPEWFYRIKRRAYEGKEQG